MHKNAKEDCGVQSGVKHHNPHLYFCALICNVYLTFFGTYWQLIIFK